MKHGKKYVDSRKAVDASKQYASEEALGLVCENAKAKFDETVEAHIRLGVDSRHADQQVRGAVVLPNGTGKTVRVCVFCKEDKYEAAKAAGADFVGGEELIPKIQNEGWLDFDVVVATPDMMGVVGRLEKTAQLAKEHGFDYFCTTLSISPLKNAQKLNEIGEELADTYGIPWLPSDFKKKNGYKRSVELSALYGLYRQDYCGCVFSKKERERQIASELI